MILDIDLLQMISEFLQPVSTSVEDLALEAINEVGPAGHFFGTEHTQARYRDAFYSPILSDWRNFETWQEAGSPIAIERANAEWKKRLASYEAPVLDPAIRDELDAFVAKRKAEGARRKLAQSVSEEEREARMERARKKKEEKLAREEEEYRKMTPAQQAKRDEARAAKRMKKRMRGSVRIKTA